MESQEKAQSRRKWHEVSPRRVTGTVLRGFGLVGVAFGAVNYALGRWNDVLDPAFLAASVLMLLVSIPLLWRVKPAAWP